MGSAFMFTILGILLLQSPFFIFCKYCVTGVSQYSNLCPPFGAVQNVPKFFLLLNGRLRLDRLSGARASSNSSVCCNELPNIFASPMVEIS